MSLPAIVNPFEVFLDQRGAALNGGKVYIGVAGQDPQTNPQTVYWDDTGVTVAAQPLQTMGGYIYRAGSPARVYVNNDYSIRVRDRLDAQVYYVQTVTAEKDVTTNSVDLFDVIPDRFHAGLIAGTELGDMTSYVLAWNALGVAGAALTAPKCTIYVGAQTIITAPVISWPNTTIKPVAGAYPTSTIFRNEWATYDDVTGVPIAYAVGDAVCFIVTFETIDAGITPTALMYRCTEAHAPTLSNYPTAVGAKWSLLGSGYSIFMLFNNITNAQHVGPIISVDPNLFPNIYAGYYNNCSGYVLNYWAPKGGASGLQLANCVNFRAMSPVIGDFSLHGIQHIGQTQRNSVSTNAVVKTTMGCGIGVQILGGTDCASYDFYSEGARAFGCQIGGTPTTGTGAGHRLRGKSYNSHHEAANYIGPCERGKIEVSGSWSASVSIDFGASYDADGGNIIDCELVADIYGAAYSGICLTTGGNLTSVIKRPVVKGRVRDCATRFVQGTAATLATTANDSLSGLAARDGITPIAGTRVLVKNQTTLSQNGIYVAAAGAWARATDADAWPELVGLTVNVLSGTINGGLWFSCRARPGGALGASNVIWDPSRESGVWAPGAIQDGDFDIEVVDTRTPARHAYNISFADLGFSVASNNKVRLASEAGGYYAGHSFRSTGANSITDLRIRSTSVAPLATTGAFTTATAAWTWWYEGDGIRVSNLEVSITAVGTGVGPIKVPPPVGPVEAKGALIGQVYSGTGTGKLIKGSMRGGFASLDFVDGANAAANAVFEVAGSYQAT